MLKTITKETHVCDSCGVETYPHPCLKCGVSYCYACSDKKKMKEYHHAVGVGGSDDGRYCNPCDTALSQARNNPLHNAYRAVEALEKEQANWHSDFRLREKMADEALGRLIKK